MFHQGCNIVRTSFVFFLLFLASCSSDHSKENPTLEFSTQKCFAEQLDPLPYSSKTLELLPEVIEKTHGIFDGTRTGIIHGLRMQSAFDQAKKQELSVESKKLLDLAFHRAVLERSKVQDTSETKTFKKVYGQFNEHHPGQLICCLAESGVPINQIVSVNSVAYRAEDLVREAQQQFAIQGEFEWQAVALAFYSPQVTLWNGKQGEEVTWEKVITELINRAHSYGETNSSCAGTHSLYALAVLYRVSAIKIPDGLRADIVAAFQSVSKCLRYSQLADGSWDNNWKFCQQVPANARSSPMERLLVTGHHLEWMALVPQEMRPEKSVIIEAGNLVTTTISAMALQDIQKYPCACSHGVRAFLLKPDNRLAGIFSNPVPKENER